MRLTAFYKKTERGQTFLSRRSVRLLPAAAALLFGVLCLLAQPGTASAAPSAPPSTPELIDQAHATGAISAEERILLLAYAVYEPDSLPVAYRSDSPWFGTDAVAEIRAAYGALEDDDSQVTAAGTAELSRLLRSAAATVCDQDDGANNLQSTNFRLNYDTISGGVTAQRYLDSLEQAYAVEVTEYGWAKPPYCVAGVGGCVETNPWNRYPVQVVDLGGGLYGYVTAPGGNYADFVGDNPNTPTKESDSVASCMVLNRDYSSFPGGALFALDVTTAHEFVHSIQFGYGDPGSSENAMWYESMAADVEDDVLDDANDNYQYLWPEFDLCLGNIPSQPFGLRYSYWPFFRYAGEQHGGEVLFQSFWENVAQGQPALIAYARALTEQGANLNDTYHDFAIATGFLQECPDSSPYCYVEGAGYAGVVGLPEIHGAVDGTGDAFSGALQNHYALNWIQLPVDGPYNVAFAVDADAPGPLRVSLVAESPSGLTVTPLTPAAGARAATLPLYTPPTGATRVLAVITNQEMTSVTPSFCATSAYTLSVDVPAAIALAVSAPSDSLLAPDESVVQTFSLRNTGTENETFDLTVTSSQGWAEATGLPSSLAIPSGATRTVDVTVTVPSDVELGMVEETALTATSASAGNISGRATVRTTAQSATASAAYLPLLMARSANEPCTPQAGESDTFQDALRFCSGQTVSGEVNDTNDFDDVYAIYAAAGTVLELTLNGNGGDADLFLYHPNSTDIVADPWVAASARDGSNESLRFLIPETGLWLIDVYAYEGSISYALTATVKANDGFYSCTAAPAGESDNIVDAITICNGQAVTGSVDQADLDDVYRLTIPGGWYLTVHLTGSGGDGDLYLFAPNATDVTTDTPVADSNTSGNSEFITGRTSGEGSWYVNVFSYDGAVNYTLHAYVAEIGFAGAAGRDNKVGKKTAPSILSQGIDKRSHHAAGRR